MTCPCRAEIERRGANAHHSRDVVRKLFDLDIVPARKIRGAMAAPPSGQHTAIKARDLEGAFQTVVGDDGDDGALPPEANVPELYQGR